MIKGVNKHIVEINCTRNEYIEKAILFVNPGKADLPRALLNKKAEDYLQTLLPQKKNDKELRARRNGIIAIGVALVCVLLFCLVLSFCI